jgi:hypothetical protein
LWNDSPQEIYFWEEDDPSSLNHNILFRCSRWRSRNCNKQ